MIKRSAFIISFLAILLPLRGASAIESLSTAELTSHCVHYAESVDKTGADAIFCVRYIQGFIDGAIATDEKVAQNVKAELARSETFSERAFRTRTPKRDRKEPTYYAEFCLGDPVLLKEIVAKVVQYLQNNDVVSSQPVARNAVYNALLKEYPCKTE